MAEKKPPPIIGVKPVPMKLFATWEVDRTPPNCIPRLCSLSLSRLVVLKNLGSDLVSSIVIAVKMQNEPLLHPDPSSKVTNKLQNQVNKIIMSKGSKRTLRSHELVLPPNGLLDTELELNFSLQYPHFLKRDGNKLHIMLQRRKRYKNRTILGYKTLAEGIINMSQVLQRQMDIELDLVTDGKESKTHNNVVARVTVNTLSSQPVDHEGSLKPSQAGRGEYSDEEEDFSSNDEGSDSEPMLEEPRMRKTSIPPDSARQRNLKQKFISLLKRFRVNEDLQGLDTDREAISSKLSGGEMDPADIEDLFEELEDMSDSGPEMDTMSISSTPKPSLRPFFSSSRSLLHEALNVPGSISQYHLPLPLQSPYGGEKKIEGRPLRNGTTSPHANSQLQLAERGVERLSDESSKKADSDSHPDSDPAPTASSPPKSLEEKKDPCERERKGRLFARDKNSSSGGKKKPASERSSSTVISPGQIQPDLTMAEPRKVVMEQLIRVLSAEDWLPEQLSLVNTGDPLGALIASRLQEKQHKVICTAGSADVKATVSYLVNKIQKFCNTSAKPPSVIKLLLAGSDSYINCVLRHYVEQLSLKPPDWQSYIRFLVVPLGNNTVSRYLGSLDGVYNSTFASDNWKETVEKADANEVVNRIQRYLQNASVIVNLPIAEAMLTYKEKSSDDESSQIFIPFMNDVRLGSPDLVMTASLELEDTVLGLGCIPPPSGSPPASLTSNPDRKVTPPSSPNMNSLNITHNKDINEPLELQIDFWVTPGKQSDTKTEIGTKGKLDNTKSTLKSAFRSLQIVRLSAPGEQPSSHFTLSYSTKEKKQKIMRLGKKKEKEKENEPKSQVVDGVYRLICSPKTQNIPLKLSIDGTEWTGVKFFQLSAQWQTHIRFFPISLFSGPDNSSGWNFEPFLKNIEIL